MNLNLSEEYLRRCENIFENLFVLELANNHWGSLDRGFDIIDSYSRVVRDNNVRAAIKLQIRDVDSFVHKDFKKRDDLRYIYKTQATKMTKDQHQQMVNRIIQNGCIPMATPFDEKSVDWAVDIGCKILKIASSDINDWFLLQKMATKNMPVMASTGGASLKDIDDMVIFFTNRNIPLAINHCVSNYPSEDGELEMNQVDFLRDRYRGLVIGHSTHEYTDWNNSMLISYAKGVRTWERHIDILYPPDHQQKQVSKYCSLPHQIDTYFKAFHKAKEMCGTSSFERRIIEIKEAKYLDALKRGVYFKTSLRKGHILTLEDVYLAAPLQRGQMSSKEFMVGDKLKESVTADSPVMGEHIFNQRFLPTDRGLAE